MLEIETNVQKAPYLLKPTESRQGQPYNVLGMRVYLKVAASDTQGRMSMFTSEYRKNEGPPLHQHPMDETFYVMEGEFLFQTGQIQVKAAPGDIIFIPGNTPHAFITQSETGKLLFMLNPSETVETLFTRLSACTQMPSMEEIVRIHEELGLQILGPPLQVS